MNLWHFSEIHFLLLNLTFPHICPHSWASLHQQGWTKTSPPPRDDSTLAGATPTSLPWWRIHHLIILLCVRASCTWWEACHQLQAYFCSTWIPSPIGVSNFFPRCLSATWNSKLKKIEVNAMAIVVTQSFCKHSAKNQIPEHNFDHCKLTSIGQDVRLCVSYLFEVCTCSLSVSALLDVGTGATVQLTNTVSCCQWSIVFCFLFKGTPQKPL